MHLRQITRLTAGFLFATFATAAAYAQQDQVNPPRRTPPVIELTPPANGAAPRSVKERYSYAIGLDLGHNFRNQGIEIDSDLLARGIADAIANAKPLLTDQELQVAMQELDRITFERESQMNKKEGEAFLAENKQKPGVQTTPSGLQYKVLREGQGATPTTADMVTANYRGTFIDGTEFDTSYGKQPFAFLVSPPKGQPGVIRGLREAVQMMKVGDKWQIYVPTELAYGEKGMKLAIPPNATLIFDIELLDVKKAPAAGAAGRPE